MRKKLFPDQHCLITPQPPKKDGFSFEMDHYISSFLELHFNHHHHPLNFDKVFFFFFYTEGRLRWRNIHTLFHKQSNLIWTSSKF